MLHTSQAQAFETLNSLADDGVVVNRDSEDYAEVAFLQLNTSKPPLDDVRIRRAMAMAIDRQNYRDVITKGLFTMASGPFGPGSVGFLEDAGFPGQDIQGAKDLVAQYEAEKGPLPKITLQDTPDAGARETATYLQQAFSQVGIDIDLATVQQDKQIDNAISGEYDLTGFRNYPGGDPDELYVWFKSGSPANFSRIDDPEIDALLDEGRSEPDPAKRAQIYEDINREFGKEAYSLWENWTTWRISSLPDVHGYTLDTLPKLPDGSDPFPGLATGHPTLGLWVAQ